MSHVEAVETDYAPMDDTKGAALQHVNTLGSVRLRNVETNEIVLVPQPSDDPNDPLNW